MSCLRRPGEPLPEMFRKPNCWLFVTLASMDRRVKPAEGVVAVGV